jgi:EpsI family protein
VLTYYYGKQATGDTWHDVSGWLVYALALALLIGANYLLRKIFGSGTPGFGGFQRGPSMRRPSALPVILVLFGAGLGMAWIANRGEVQLERQTLRTLPERLGDWRQRGDEIKFSEQTESVLRTTDYTMREYTAPDGRVANIYVGYYGSQRSGATYHSPQNCLPGAGWVMSSPEPIEITRSDGEVFTANRYTVENGVYREVMIYWYQGRGRTVASEYTDKINTVWDSIFRSRSDGAMVRVMTGIGTDEAAAVAAAAALSSSLADSLPAFIPD